MPASTTLQTSSHSKFVGLILSACLLVACGGGTQANELEDPSSALPPLSATVVDLTEVNAGGELSTVDDSSVDAFGRASPGLGFRDESLFEIGNHLFRTPRGRERGTGPLFNAQTCQGCHVRDGKGNPPRSAEQPLAPDVDPTSMLLRLAQSGNAAPDPIYGGQLQGRSLYGGQNNPDGTPLLDASLNGGPALGEAKVRVEYEVITGNYPDGVAYELLRPIYRLSNFSYGAMADDIRVSARVAPGVYGNGLLGAISATDIRLGIDPDDVDGDGISGRANTVPDSVTGAEQLGRFGLKAKTASVLSQGAAAYRGDMGLTNQFAPEENCTSAQMACIAASNTELVEFHEPAGVDVADIDLAQVEFYNRTLAVPKRRGWDPTNKRWTPAIQRGREQFFEVGCIGCHTPRWKTGTAQGSVLGDASTLTTLIKPAPTIAALSDQIIWPYTDMLLHDMGGSCSTTRETALGLACPDQASSCTIVQQCTGLADGVAEHQASGAEWRTAPLWGVGLAQTVNPDAGFLHDGRARTLEEAILWHGQSADSEAAATTNRFKSLSAADRTAILSYLRSL